MIRHDDIYGRTSQVPETPLFAVTLLKWFAVASVAMIVLAIGLAVWTTTKVAKWAAILLPGLFHAGRKDW